MFDQTTCYRIQGDSEQQACSQPAPGHIWIRECGPRLTPAHLEQARLEKVQRDEQRVLLQHTDTVILVEMEANTRPAPQPTRLWYVLYLNASAMISGRRVWLWRTDRTRHWADRNTSRCSCWRYFLSPLKNPPTGPDEKEPCTRIYTCNHRYVPRFMLSSYSWNDGSHNTYSSRLLTKKTCTTVSPSASFLIQLNYSVSFRGFIPARGGAGGCPCPWWSPTSHPSISSPLLVFRPRGICEIFPACLPANCLRAL